MGYVDSNLATGEQVVHRTTLYWLVYPKLTFLGLFLLFIPNIRIIGIAIVMAALILGFAKRSGTEFAVTSRRIIINVGFISHRTLELNLGKVESASVQQGMLGRLLNYGTITLRGTGGTHERLEGIAEPLLFRQKVAEATEASQRLPGVPAAQAVAESKQTAS